MINNTSQSEKQYYIYNENDELICHKNRNSVPFEELSKVANKLICLIKY